MGVTPSTTTGTWTMAIASCEKLQTTQRLLFLTASSPVRAPLRGSRSTGGDIESSVSSQHTSEASVRHAPQARPSKYSGTYIPDSATIDASMAASGRAFTRRIDHSPASCCAGRTQSLMPRVCKASHFCRHHGDELANSTLDEFTVGRCSSLEITLGAKCTGNRLALSARVGSTSDHPRGGHPSLCRQPCSLPLGGRCPLPTACGRWPCIS